MQYMTEAAGFTRVTSTGVAVLTSGPVSVVGVAVAAVLTGQIVQFFTQTAASVTGVPVLGTATMAANTFYRFPASLPKGLTYCVTNEDVDLTIFWNPAGSAS